MVNKRGTSTQKSQNSLIAALEERKKVFGPGEGAIIEKR